MEGKRLEARLCFSANVHLLTDDRIKLNYATNTFEAAGASSPSQRAVNQSHSLQAHTVTDSMMIHKLILSVNIICM